MQLTVIKSSKLSILVMPESVTGNYWITDFENGKKINLINIEATEQGWKLISNQDAFVTDSAGLMIPFVILKEYGFYLLKNNYKNESYYLFCSPVYDKSIKEYGIAGDKPIKVGSGKECEICFKLNGVAENVFNIEKKENYYYLNILDNISAVYINKKRIISNKRLEYGDIIFIYGLKIILMRKNGKDYLLVNNPNNMLQYNTSFANIIAPKSEFKESNEELTESSTRVDEDFFYRTPRFYKDVKHYSLSIDEPPEKKEEDKTPAILTVGPMVTMAMTSAVMLLSTFNSISSGKTDLNSSMTSIVMSIAMLVSCLLWPLLTSAYQKFSNKAYERKRKKLYKKYISKKEKEIETELQLQKKALLENYFSISQCQDIIKGHKIDLWQRRITDGDFLEIPVGYGTTKMDIEIKYPEDRFSLSEDNLLDIARELGKKERVISDVPITFSFYKNISTGIVGNPILTKEFVDRIILQIMANYSYDEVKFVVFTSKENENDWDYIKVLPHTWSNDKSIRFFGSSNDDYREIIYSIEKIFNERKEQEKAEEKRHEPHYIIITDAIKSIDTFDFIDNMMANNSNYGFSIIILCDKLSALPNECKNFIEVNKEESNIFSSIINGESQKFKIDFSSIEDIYNCAKELANIPIYIKTETEGTLPDTYHFLEMFQVGKIEQLNVKERWKASNPILSLQTEIGVGKSGEAISLDLHEKYHGPHGLIAGTTGSGKSEFIITYILSLALNYHPYEVQIILIDYKGGSLAGAFQTEKYRLPHIVGTITNLDGSELNRSLASIESELKRRQRKFNEAKAMANESTIDIYKYQKLWRNGKLKGMDPIAHLFIISDEFAELKEQQPDFMNKLISTARVGRSLGIHLILATQKPGGVVDPQIWSNTRFRVCLKVQDTSDSQEVLKRPEAAYLKKAGRFYLQVGYDEVFTLGQSSWAGGQYYPRTIFKKEVDTSINIINNIGLIIKTKDIENTEIVKPQGEELPNVVKYINDAAIEEELIIKKLWLDKMSDKMIVKALKSKYNFERTPFEINPIIGEYDDPSNQNQNALTMPLSTEGNALIYGIAGSGKSDMLVTLIYSCMISYHPQEVNFYIVDFGSETLRMFNKSPYVGDVVFVEEAEKIRNLFKMISNELVERRNLFADHGGSYKEYIKSKKGVIPNYVIIINNFESFIENYEDLEDELNVLSRDSTKCGIFFIITATSDGGVRFKTKQNFALLYALQQNNETDYFDILGNCRGKIPSKIKGRGLFKKDEIYEFQTAKVVDDVNITEYIYDYCEQCAKAYPTYIPKKIPILPEIVDYRFIKDYLTKDSNYVIGVSKNKLTIEKYNFRKNAINLICGYEPENSLKFINSLISEIGFINYYDLILINTTEQDLVNDYINDKTYTKDFDKIITDLDSKIQAAYEEYKASGFNEETISSKRPIMCFIYGINNFINKLSEETKEKLVNMMKNDNLINLVSFVVFDNPDIISEFAYEDWFKSGCDTSKGIWIGNGIGDQSLFKIAKIESTDREDIDNDFGYIVTSSKIIKVKLLDEFNSK